MSNWEQLNYECRKIIRSGLSQNKKLYEISDSLEYDPTTISKEIKRNRILHYRSTNKDKVCLC
ncbi:MAG: helix-turn-helix domain-containing protein [Bacilli bacterium]|jgi:IS30 family transposase